MALFMVQTQAAQPGASYENLLTMRQPGAGYGSMRLPSAGYGSMRLPSAGYMYPPPVMQPGAGYEYPLTMRQPGAGYGSMRQPNAGYGSMRQPGAGFKYPPPEIQPDVGYGYLTPETERISLSGVREFKHDLCDCAGDCEVCCYGYFCSPCMACDVANSLDEAVLYCCLSDLYRMKVRHQYRIKGSALNDCFAMQCFSPCAYCQMYRELKHHGNLDPCCWKI